MRTHYRNHYAEEAFHREGARPEREPPLNAQHQTT